MKALKQDRPAIRQRAAIALVEGGKPITLSEVLPFLVEGAISGGKEEFEDSCHALAKLGPRAAAVLPNLKEALKDEETALSRRGDFIERAVTAIESGVPYGKINWPRTNKPSAGRT